MQRQCLARLVHEAQRGAHRLGEAGIVAPQRGAWKPPARIALQRHVGLGEADEADAALRRSHEQTTGSAIGESGADGLALSARRAAPRVMPSNVSMCS
jgi:hypothetical protein